MYSVALETRCAFFEESVQPLATVLGQKTVKLQTVFFVDRLTKRLVCLADHGALYVPVSKRRPFREMLGEVPRFLIELIVRVHPIHDPNSSRLLGREALRGIEKFGGARHPHEPRQKKRCAQVGT